MPTYAQRQEIARLEREVKDRVDRIAHLKTAGNREARLDAHPGEPYIPNLSDMLVKVYFTGDKDGNGFALCLPTRDTKRVTTRNGGRAIYRMWKYTYENATGTSGVRSFPGMLRTLDGHGRTVTKIEQISGGRVIVLYRHG